MSIPSKNGRGKWFQDAHMRASSRSVRYAAAVSFVAGATALVAAVQLSWGFSPFLVFVAAVCINAVIFGIDAGIVALLLATLASDFFFIEPRLSFSLKRQVFTLGGLYACGAILSLMFARRFVNKPGRNQRRLWC